MAAYRDAAVAAYNDRAVTEEQQAQAERDAFEQQARQVAAPLFKNAAGTLVIPQTQIVKVLVDMAARLVVLRVNDDGSVTNTGHPIVFAVYPDNGKARLIKKVDGVWQEGPWVKDLDDVGAVLAGGEW